jgi:hypothetical protein
MLFRHPEGGLHQAERDGVVAGQLAVTYASSM